MSKLNDSEEREYRRGYCDGYIEALNDLNHMMTKETTVVDVDDVYPVLFNVWIDKLAKWAADGDMKIPELPPNIINQSNGAA